MDWLTSLIDGLGSAISGAFENLWNSVSGSIWDVFLKWIFEAIYGAIADFFTMIGGMLDCFFASHAPIFGAFNLAEKYYPRAWSHACRE